MGCRVHTLTRMLKHFSSPPCNGNNFVRVPHNGDIISKSSLKDM